jgi:hypothetical protein
MSKNKNTTDVSEDPGVSFFRVFEEFLLLFHNMVLHTINSILQNLLSHAESISYSKEISHLLSKAEVRFKVRKSYLF